MMSLEDNEALTASASWSANKKLKSKELAQVEGEARPWASRSTPLILRTTGPTPFHFGRAQASKG
ncbi:hypothetical protein NBRC3188_2780 [Acetobacter pasteurianus NBRC 3188]|uniref:Uncharacterized protein n=1 Tax=Acetobacter pasteurianus NBRC 3188 TaxID=1226663 RepID=A0A401WXR2_ACEPA|nr:hypothetical protein NBRC3188_2780 [Acetobacter pasteurianus NBRC 3188]